MTAGRPDAATGSAFAFDEVDYTNPTVVETCIAAAKRMDTPVESKGAECVCHLFREPADDQNLDDVMEWMHEEPRESADTEGVAGPSRSEQVEVPDELSAGDFLRNSKYEV